MSLILSVYREGSHVTITHDALDLTIQGPTALAPDSSLSAHGHSWPQPPGSDIWWQSLETCNKCVLLRTPFLLVTFDGQDWRLAQTRNLASQVCSEVSKDSLRKNVSRSPKQWEFKNEPHSVLSLHPFPKKKRTEIIITIIPNSFIFRARRQEI